MQVKISDILAEISSKNEIVNFQANQLSERISALENEVYNLPKSLTTIIKTELAKHKTEIMELLSKKRRDPYSKEQFLRHSEEVPARPSCSYMDKS